jgi:hypothetical protein
MQKYHYFCQGMLVAPFVPTGLLPCRCIQLCQELLGSNGTFLNSPSGSMTFLHSTRAFALCRLMKIVCCSGSSCRKCIFLWPDAKPFSMFLASY